MSLISTAVTCVPHGSVCLSMTFLICSLMPAVSDKQLVEAEAADDIAHGGLADLIDRIVDVLDHDHRILGIGDMIIGNRRDIDRDVVLGDDLLRGNLHRDGAQRDTHHLLERKEDERDPGSANAFEFSKKKYDSALVLFQHAKSHRRHREVPQCRDYRSNTWCFPLVIIARQKFKRPPERIVGIFSLLSLFGKRSRVSDAGRLPRPEQQV